MVPVESRSGIGDLTRSWGAIDYPSLAAVTTIWLMEDVTAADTGARDSARPRPATTAKLVGAVLVLAAFVVFAWQNSSSIDVEFLAFSFGVPLFVLMILSAFVGIAVWELVGFLRRRSTT